MTDLPELILRGRAIIRSGALTAHPRARAQWIRRRDGRSLRLLRRHVIRNVSQRARTYDNRRLRANVRRATADLFGPSTRRAGRRVWGCRNARIETRLSVSSLFMRYCQFPGRQDCTRRPMGAIRAVSRRSFVSSERDITAPDGARQSRPRKPHRANRVTVTSIIPV